MGRIFLVPFTGTITNAGGNTDLWEFAPAANHPVSLRWFRLGQTSEVGEAAEEGLELTVKRLRATVTSGSGGATATAEEPNASNQAPSFTNPVEVNNTTVATTTGDTEILDEIAWNNRNSPLEIRYLERDERPKALNGELLLIRLETTPADDFTFAGVACVEEE